MISDPREVPYHLRSELNYAGRQINQFYYKKRGRPQGYSLMTEDWDTAIILDSCRYDYFVEQNRFDSPVERKISPGSESREFMKQFLGKKYHDTVYVTGNPYITIVEDDTFHDIRIDDAWTDSATEAPPDRLTTAAKEAHEEYPHKRIIVHYMQPHFPILHPNYTYLNDEVWKARQQLWPINTTAEEIREGYRANLEYVLDYVEELLETIKGKVIITADHGEMLGERQRPIPIKGFNHHENLYVNELIEVPWSVINTGPRREIRSEEPIRELNVDEDVRQQRLQALGYV